MTVTIANARPKIFVFFHCRNEMIAKTIPMPGSIIAVQEIMLATVLEKYPNDSV